MKKAGFILLAAVLLCTGCVSQGRTALLAQRDPIALVSISANREINWKGEDSASSGLAGLFSRRALRADPDQTFVSDAEDLITVAERLIWETLAESELINLAERDTILLSQAYGEARLNRRQTQRGDLAPEGFRLIDSRDRTFPPALAEETGIQRSMFVEFNLDKVMRNGLGKSGTCGASVEMRVLILDALGKGVFDRTFTAGSLSTIRVLAGRYSQSGLMELFEEAIAGVLLEFLFYLGD